MSSVISAAKADYAAIQKFLEDAYNHATDFFPLHYPWCWREENTDFGHTYLIRESAQIVSLVRMFPLDLSLGGVQIRIGGIGGVSTKPSCRGKGYMSQLLQHAVDQMKAEQMPVPILWGDQHRYQSFGYQTAGQAVTLAISRRGLEKMRVSPLEGVRFQGQPELLSQMIQAYHAHAFHRRRTLEEFRLVCRHPDLLLFCTQAKDPFAYLGLMNGAPVEYGGDMQNVLGLTAHLMTRLGRWTMDFRFPHWAAVPASVRAAAWTWKIEPTGQIKILDLEKTLTGFAPQAPEAIIPPLQKLRAMPESQQTEALFGTAHGSPFNIWVWPLDNI